MKFNYGKDCKNFKKNFGFDDSKCTECGEYYRLYFVHCKKSCNDKPLMVSKKTKSQRNISNTDDEIQTQVRRIQRPTRTSSAQPDPEDRAEEPNDIRARAREALEERIRPHRELENINETISDLFERLIETAESEISDYNDEDNLFYARAKTVKKIKRASDKLFKKYSRELNFSKEDVYPKKWMIRDVKISSAFERLPLTVNLLNYLFNVNRRIKGDKYKGMVDLADIVTGGKTHNNRWNYSSFVIDTVFYETIASKFGYSEIYIRKYIKAFKKMGIIKLLGFVETKKVGRNPPLYADGYIVDTTIGKRKIHFLKNDKKFRERLRKLPDFLNK